MIGILRGARKVTWNFADEKRSRGSAQTAGLCLVGRPSRRDAPSSGSRLDANAVINGRLNALLAAEVPLGRLNRNVPEQELNLLQLATRRMAESSTCPPEVVRREPVNARFTGVSPNDVPDRFLRQAVTPGVPVFVYPTEYLSSGQIRSLKPLIDEGFDPAWHRYCPGVAGLAFQVDDGPVLFPLLDVAEAQVHR